MNPDMGAAGMKVAHFTLERYSICDQHLERQLRTLQIVAMNEVMLAQSLEFILRAVNDVPISGVRQDKAAFEIGLGHPNSRLVDNGGEAFLAGLKRQIDSFASGDVDECDNHAVDDILDRAVWAKPHDECRV